MYESTGGAILIQTTTPVHAIMGHDVTRWFWASILLLLPDISRSLRAQAWRARKPPGCPVLVPAPRARPRPLGPALSSRAGPAASLLRRHLPSRPARRGPETARGTGRDWLQLAAGSPAPAALDNRSLRSGAVGGGLRADARRAGRRADGLTCGLPSPDRRPRARALAGNRLPWAPAPPASPPRFPPRRRRFCRLRPEPSGEWIPRGGGGPPGTVGCHGHPSPPVTILMRRRPRGPPGGVCGPGRSVLGRLGGGVTAEKMGRG